jgi:hypothetical protein
LAVVAEVVLVAEVPVAVLAAVDSVAALAAADLAVAEPEEVGNILKQYKTKPDSFRLLF